jgi:hypothetical protein
MEDMGITLIITGGVLGLLGIISFSIHKIITGGVLGLLGIISFSIHKLKLEIQKQNNQIKLLEEENKKYDRIIDENSKNR